jgi:hypothetical protein
MMSSNYNILMCVSFGFSSYDSAYQFICIYDNFGFFKTKQNLFFLILIIRLFGRTLRQNLTGGFIIYFIHNRKSEPQESKDPRRVCIWLSRHTSRFSVNPIVPYYNSAEVVCEYKL